MRWIGDEYSHYEVGQVGFLISTENEIKPAPASYRLADHPARGNMSGEQKLTGWCGTTNDIRVEAHGLARVVKVARNGRAQVEVLTGQDLIDALEELGYPDLAPEEEE